MVDDELHLVSEYIDDAIFDVRYATDNNFTGIQQYDYPYVCLRKEPLDNLCTAVDVLRNQGYVLVIFDAYRPLSVQKELQKYCSNTDYVAAVSNHCRGITVDVTLADGNGNYLDMGTDYDDFSERAHSDSPLISSQQQANRELLRNVLTEFGFVEHPYEWWHFDYQPEQSWPLIPSLPAHIYNK